MQFHGQGRSVEALIALTYYEINGSNKPSEVSRQVKNSLVEKFLFKGKNLDNALFDQAKYGETITLVKTEDWSLSPITVTEIKPEYLTYEFR